MKKLDSSESTMRKIANIIQNAVIRVHIDNKDLSMTQREKSLNMLMLAYKAKVNDTADLSTESILNLIDDWKKSQEDLDKMYYNQESGFYKNLTDKVMEVVNELR